MGRPRIFNEPIAPTVAVVPVKTLEAYKAIVGYGNVSRSIRAHIESVVEKHDNRSTETKTA